MALYVYGIMRAADAAKATRKGEVEAVPQDGVAALVREVPDEELRLRRETILGHADVLQAAFKHGPVLPLRFGTAVADAGAVAQDMLAPRTDVLVSRLDALGGKAEMQVKAVYAEAPLLRSILDADPALRRAVDRVRGMPPAATHFDQIRIGEAIAAAVQARRAADGDAVLGALRPLALGVAVSDPHHERAVLNAAFLIDADELSKFDAAVEQLSTQYSSEIEFKLIGPLPAYSFAERDWEAPAAAGRNA